MCLSCARTCVSPGKFDSRHSGTRRVCVGGNVLKIYWHYSINYCANIFACKYRYTRTQREGPGPRPVSGREFVINCELDCMKLLPVPNLFILVVPVVRMAQRTGSFNHSISQSLTHSSVYAARRSPQTSESGVGGCASWAMTMSMSVSAVRRPEASASHCYRWRGPSAGMISH